MKQWKRFLGPVATIAAGLALALSLAFGAAPETLTYLKAPTGVLVNGQSTCVANVINGDGTVSGTCQSVTRFSRPWLADLYVATWLGDGTVASSAKCGSASNSNGQTKVIIDAGYTAETCFLPVYASPPLEAQQINGAWYNYITGQVGFRLFTDRFHGLIVSP